MTTADDDLDPPDLDDEESESFEEQLPEDEHDAAPTGPAESGPVDLTPFRKPRVRARTVSIKRMSKRDLERGRLMYPTPEGLTRPVTRADCLQGDNSERPCPWVSCKHHLYLDIAERSGAIKMNFPDREPEDLTESCALDVADRGGVTLEEVGEIMNLTRERVRQLETRGLVQLKKHGGPTLASLAELSEVAAYQDDEDEDEEPADRRLVQRIDPESASDQVLTLLRGTPATLALREITSALSLTDVVARSALRRLRGKGLVRSEGGGCATRWRAVRPEGAP